MWVCLNDDGKKVWGDVFPDGKVPVCDMTFESADLEGYIIPTEIVLVNWVLLSKSQQKAVLSKISVKCGVSENDIQQQILAIGLPLRKSLTTGVIWAELRYFI